MHHFEDGLKTLLPRYPKASHLAPSAHAQVTPPPCPSFTHGKHRVTEREHISEPIGAFNPDMVSTSRHHELCEICMHILAMNISLAPFIIGISII